MRAFHLRAATKDLTGDSEVVIITEDKVIFDVVDVKRECAEIMDAETGTVKSIYPCHLVLVIKARPPVTEQNPPSTNGVPKKIAGSKIRGMGV